ncbi:MBL fold metallo-hydrolase [Marinitoga sp. 38H-ov]|uniref:MBL fold metallo-hydrolase n=1 Tax=Marinitoga sp. 38H-ov TaxID=1755814 RepID=UPI0013EBDB4E|nr:MBL fold metallo-hydrolase [Marinitoga sp. 38H-ov]KAF2955773.1 hypothetical protein AS160_09015 [Marinitoga sp. 38H-ov]
MKLIPFYSKDDIKVYMLILPPFGTNSYIIQKNRTIIVIDPGKGINIINNYLDIEGYKNKGILITHTHFDHIYGLNELKDFNIFIPEKEEEGLKNPAKNLIYLINEEIEFKVNHNIIYEGYHNIGDLKFIATYFPGHTPGSMVYDFGDFIFTGDFIFSNSIGRTDLPYGDEKLMFKSIDKFKKYIKSKEGKTIIFPGHMDICNINYLIENNLFLGGCA